MPDNTKNSIISKINEIKNHLNSCDGVMIGRSIYQNPYSLIDIEKKRGLFVKAHFVEHINYFYVKTFGSPTVPPSENLAIEYLTPKEIIEKKKWGFAVNPYLQFQKDLKQTVEKVLTQEFVENQGIFNYSYIRSILDYKPNPKLRWHYNFLWILTGLAIWEKMFIQSDAFLQKDHSLETYFN